MIRLACRPAACRPPLARARARGRRRSRPPRAAHRLGRALPAGEVEQVKPARAAVPGIRLKNAGSLPDGTPLPQRLHANADGPSARAASLCRCAPSSPAHWRRFTFSWSRTRNAERCHYRCGPGPCKAPRAACDRAAERQALIDLAAACVASAAELPAPTQGAGRTPGAEAEQTPRRAARQAPSRVGEMAGETWTSGARTVPCDPHDHHRQPTGMTSSRTSTGIAPTCRSRIAAFE